jgi:hypothetical protein
MRSTKISPCSIASLCQGEDVGEVSVVHVVLGSNTRLDGLRLHIDLHLHRARPRQIG